MEIRKRGESKVEIACEFQNNTSVTSNEAEVARSSLDRSHASEVVVTDLLCLRQRRLKLDWGGSRFWFGGNSGAFIYLLPKLSQPSLSIFMPVMLRVMHVLCLNTS